MQISNLNNNSASVENGYSDFTDLSAVVTKGVSYYLNVNVNTDGNVTYYIRAWIDWNQDGDFLDQGESFNLGTARNVTGGLTSMSPLSITIPTTAKFGFTRMRISTKYNTYPNSCETDFNGEVEDYSIKVDLIVLHMGMVMMGTQQELD